jgi:hypothetical protein
MESPFKDWHRYSIDTTWIDCGCSDAHHAIRVWYDDEGNEVLLEMRVNQYRSFWKRAQQAFKYLFNINNKENMYDSFLIDTTNKDIFVRAISKILPEGEINVDKK